MDITKRFTDDVITEIRKQIKEADGNEVFFVGNIDSEGIVVDVVTCARGNIDSVPVNYTESRSGSVLIHNHPSGVLYPSDADLTIASDCSEKAQGFYIINNEVSDLYAVMEPIKPKTIAFLNTDETAGYISKGGNLSLISEAFEERPAQIELLKKITESFNNNNIGVFEAGTGVGKSFAYLIPSMLWSLKNKERVVISTGTINLQQQLSEKDIPIAEKIIGKKIKSILIKGRQNYICLRRLAEVSAERDLFSEDTETFEKILNWSKETENGSKSDLSFLPSESIWQRINSEADACMGMRCPKRENCFVMKVRKEAADANLLIVNHHMLFADIESRLQGVGYDDTAVLPPYKKVIFDEAHGIEDAATSFFSNSLNRFRIIKQFNLLYRVRKNSSSGFIFTLSALSRCKDHSAEILNEISLAKIDIQNLELEASASLGNDYTLRLHGGTFVRFEKILGHMKNLQIHVANITGLIREIIDGIDVEDRDNSSVYETKSILRRLDDVVTVCKNFSEWDEHQDQVFWVQGKRLSSSLAKEFDNPVYYEFVQTPLDVAPLMNKGLYEPLDTVVCTSATISIGKKFDFWKSRVGINFVEKERVLTGDFPSPFPYEKNMAFMVPSDAPFPDNVNFQSFIEDAIVKLIEAAEGKTLVLFTSYDSLRHSYDTARTRLRSTGITILKQGDDDRFRLLSKFKNDTSSVLFATDSFWEGVDVPGPSLSQVIIVKLPFGVPSDPIFAARSEQISKKGGSPFMELSVPDAVIQFRQGFGRLIRRSDDKGAVVVLDRRIVEKMYGKIFTGSVPMTKRVYKPLEEVVAEVEKNCK